MSNLLRNKKKTIWEVKSYKKTMLLLKGKMKTIFKVKGKNSKEKVNNHIEKDMISVLSDDILHCIISYLSIDDVFRTSILSNRWINLWKNALHLDFDWTRMNKPLFLNPKSATKQDAIKYAEIVNTILLQHEVNFVSCCFKHFPESLDLGDVKGWVEFVFEREKVSYLSLECKPSIHVANKFFVMSKFKPKVFSNLCSLELTKYQLQNSVLTAFENCENLKNLKLRNMFMRNSIINGILKNCVGLEKFSLLRSKGFTSLKIENRSLKTLELMWLNVSEIYVNVEELQVMVIDSLICPPKGLRIYSEKLLSFSSGCNPSDQGIKTYFRRGSILKTQDILENCSDLFESRSINIFQNLSALSINLDLNNIREAMALSYVLMSCNKLNTLEITITVEKVSVSSIASDDSALPYSKSMFWETREMFYFELYKKLKFVTLKGFTGKEQEVKLAKLLITKATMMEKMYVICDSTIVDEAKDLLSLPRASSCLSIIFKSKNKNGLIGNSEIKN